MLVTVEEALMEVSPTRVSWKEDNFTVSYSAACLYDDEETCVVMVDMLRWLAGTARWWWLAEFACYPKLKACDERAASRQPV